jgi:hypothetical protein
MLQPLRLAFVAAGVLGLASVSAHGPTLESLAVAAVRTFHQQLDEERFDDIWHGAADALREESLRQAGPIAAPRMLGLRELREKLGRVVTSSTRKSSVSSADSLVTLEQETKFERGTAVERFKFLVTGGTAKLRAYDFTSPEFAIQ